MIENRRAKSIGAEKAADDVAEASEPGEDDGIVVFVDFVRGTLRFAFLKQRPHQLFVDGKEQGRCCHAQRDRCHEQLCDFRREDGILRGESEEHEGKFATLGEGKGQEKSFAAF